MVWHGKVTSRPQRDESMVYPIDKQPRPAEVGMRGAKIGWVVEEWDNEYSLQIMA